MRNMSVWRVCSCVLRRFRGRCPNAAASRSSLKLRERLPISGSRRSTTAMRNWDAKEFGYFENARGETKPLDYLPRVDAASAAAARRPSSTMLLDQLNAIPAEQLSPDEQVNAAVFRTILENGIADARFREWEMPFNSDSSFWTYLDSREPFDDAAEYRRYIARMRDIPRYFDEQIVNMRAGLKRGFTVPRATLDGRDASVAAFIADDPRRRPSTSRSRPCPRPSRAAEQQALRAEGAAAIREAVLPAYRKLLTFLTRRISAQGAQGHCGPRASRWRRILPGPDPRIYDARHEPGGDPPDRPQGSRADRRRDAQDDARQRLQGQRSRSSSTS